MNSMDSERTSIIFPCLPVNICQSTGLVRSCSPNPTDSRQWAGHLTVPPALLHLWLPQLPPSTNSAAINVSSASIYSGSICSPSLISLGKYCSGLCRGKARSHYSNGWFLELRPTKSLQAWRQNIQPCCLFTHPSCLFITSPISSAAVAWTPADLTALRVIK